MTDDDFDNALGETISGQVGKPPSSTSDADDTDSPDDTGNSESTDDSYNTDSTSETDSTSTTSDGGGVSDTDDTGDTGTTRDRDVYAMYLSSELQEELNDRFEKFNARRSLDDLDTVQKHRHFMEGLVRAGLDSDDLEDYILEEANLSE